MAGASVGGPSGGLPIMTSWSSGFCYRGPGDGEQATGDNDCLVFGPSIHSRGQAPMAQDRQSFTSKQLAVPFSRA